MHRKGEHGKSTGVIAGFVGMGILVIALGGFGIWSFLQYQTQKGDNDARIAVAVANAQKQQSDIDEAKFAEREKDPRTAFAGPEDYGRLSFAYPKTWSQYVESDASANGASVYKAYFNPGAVPPIKDEKTKMALRVSVKSANYDTEVAQYSGLVKTGKLSSSTFSVNGTTGVKLEGEFSKDIRGSMVIFRIRDKVVTLNTDAETFKADFEALIATIKFNA